MTYEIVKLGEIRESSGWYGWGKYPLYESNDEIIVINGGDQAYLTRVDEFRYEHSKTKSHPGWYTIGYKIATPPPPPPVKLSWFQRLWAKLRGHNLPEAKVLSVGSV